MEKKKIAMDKYGLKYYLNNKYFFIKAQKKLPNRIKNKKPEKILDLQNPKK